MSKFRIQSPDGRTFDIDAPEGATQQQIMSYAKKQLGQTKAEPELTKPSDIPQDTSEAGQAPWYKKAALGSAVSTIESYQGLKDLLGGEVTENDKLALDMMRKDADAAGGWATAGNVVSEVAQLALPMAAANKGVKAHKMSKAVSAAKAAKAAKTTKAIKQAEAAKAGLKGNKALLATEAGIAGGHGYTKATEAGETRLGNAGKAVVGAGLGQLGAKVLGATVRGATKTPAAERLMTMDIPFTPARASESSLPRTLEYIMGITPTLAKGTKALQDESMDYMNLALLKQVAPDPAVVTKTGTDGMAQVKKNFDKKYLEAWSAGGKPDVKKLSAMSNDILIASRDLGVASKPVLKKAYRDIANIHNNYSAKGVKNLDNSLRKNIKTASMAGDTGLAATLQGLRNDLRESVGGDTIKMLDLVDSKYGSYVALQGAGGTKKAMEAGGNFDASDLMAGVKSAGGKGRNATGKAPLYDTALDVSKTLGIDEPSPIMSFIRGAAVNAPSPKGLLRKGGDIMLGETPTQKFLQKGYNPTADILRKYGIAGANLGASYEDN